MNATQRQRALQDFYGYLHYDWVELEVAIQCANASAGHDDFQTVTPEARAFVASLIEEEGLAVGALNQNGRFSSWPGAKREWKRRVLELMRIGERVPGLQVVWFDCSKEGPIRRSRGPRP